jgi:O-antigen/teichoic acid export membrane protein
MIGKDDIAVRGRNASVRALDSWRTYLRERVLDHFRSGLLHNASWMLGGRVFQLAGRITYFVIIAHVLGPVGYGTYVACTALLTAISPFSVFGTADVMTKYAARDRSVLPYYFGNALLVTTGFGVLLTLVALLIRPVVVPSGVSVSLLLSVAIAEFLGSQMTAICAQVFLALEEARRHAQLLTWSVALRVCAALALAASAHTPLNWAYLYAGAAVIATIGGFVAVCWCCAPPRFRLNLLVPSLREGFHFATSTATQTVYNDIDKVMLARLSTVEATAIYAVAYRFIEAAMIPIYSVAAATYPEFFRRGMSGVSSAFGFARTIIRRSVLYGTAAAAALFLGAGLVPLIMGRAYAESTVALRWICLLAVLKSVHSFLTDTLTGADQQWQRSAAQFAVALFNVLVNLWIIRAFAWRGAAWSSLLTDVLLMVLLYLIIRFHVRREKAVDAAPQSLCTSQGE